MPDSGQSPQDVLDTAYQQILPGKLRRCDKQPLAGPLAHQRPHKLLDFRPADQSPQDVLDTAYQQIQAALSDDLLGEIMGQSPSFFEHLVVKLLERMGYGGSLSDAGGGGGTQSSALPAFGRPPKRPLWCAAFGRTPEPPW